MSFYHCMAKCKTDARKYCGITQTMLGKDQTDISSQNVNPKMFRQFRESSRDRCFCSRVCYSTSWQNF